jgi:superfamily II DNA or RNA helicase
MTELRTWQREALAAVLKERKGIVSAPMGSGKSLVGLELIRRADLKAVVVCPTLNLCYQWRAGLLSHGFNNVGSLNGVSKEPGDYVVATYASALKMDSEWWKRFGVAIFDEVHHPNVAEVWGQCLTEAKNVPFVLGLSGTPGTEPRLKVVYRYNLKDAANDGVIARVEVVPVPIALSEDDMKSYLDLGDAIRTGMESISFNTLYSRPWNPKKQAVRELIEDRKRLLREAPGKFEALCEIARNAESPVLVFLPTIKDVDKVADELGDIAFPFHSKIKLTAEERERVLEFWKTGEFPVLLTAKILDEGIDVPDAKTGILLVANRSERQTLQRLGRLMRPGKNKKLYVIYSKATHEKDALGILRSVLSPIDTADGIAG